MHFRKQCNTGLLKMVFDALRHNKEEEKFTLMTTALEDETNPVIESLNKEIEVKETVEMRTGQTRAINAMQKQLRARIGSYFLKWRDEL